MDNTPHFQAVGIQLGSFSLLAALFGCMYLVLMPPMQVPDEFGHFFRVYEVSTGTCLASPNVIVPVRVAQVAAKYPGLIETRRRLSLAAIWKEAGQPNDESVKRNVGFVVGSIYNCVPYVAASAGLSLARLMHASALTEMYSGRLANLLAYVLLCSWAVYLAPGYRLLLAALALMPMSLQQAASLSVDSLTFATSFLFCAYVLKLAFDPAVKRVRGEELALLGVLIAICTSCRFNIFILLLLFLIPEFKFRARVEKFGYIALYVLLAIAIALAWQRLNQANLTLLGQERSNRGISIQSNLAAIYAIHFNSAR